MHSSVLRCTHSQRVATAMGALRGPRRSVNGWAHRWPATRALHASCRTYTSSTTASSSPTYMSMLDDVWNRKWFGTVDGPTSAASLVQDGTGEAGWLADAIMSCQELLGLEGWAVLLLVGIAARLLTLYASFYGERASARMLNALPELKAPQEAFNRVYYNDQSTSLEVQVAASILKGERRRVFAAHETSNLKCLGTLWGSPLLMWGMYEVSSLCTNTHADLGSSSFLWCSALTMPDPFFVLPVLVCGLALLNLELSIRPELRRGWTNNLIWGARIGAVCVVPVIATFRSGVCLYCIGMSLAGLLQPLLLRQPSFRRWFGFPAALPPPQQQQQQAPPAVGGAANAGGAPTITRLVAAVASPQASSSSKTCGDEVDVLQTRVSVQFPYLSHLLNPQAMEVDEPLFIKTAPSTEHRRRAAMGKNPLMREVPLRKANQNTTHEHSHDVAPRSSPSSSLSSKRTNTSTKGTSFASSGWKTANLNFDESDFTPPTSK